MILKRSDISVEEEYLLGQSASDPLLSTGFEASFDGRLPTGERIKVSAYSYESINSALQVLEERIQEAFSGESIKWV